MVNSMKITSTGVITTSQVRVVLLEWSGPGAAGDQLSLQDNTSRPVWQPVADEIDYDLWKSYGRPIDVNGLKVQTLGSGTLIIYYV